MRLRVIVLVEFFPWAAATVMANDCLAVESDARRRERLGKVLERRR